VSTDFQTSLHADYIHVQLAPGYELTPEGNAELILAISDVCARQGQRRVLIEGTVAARKMGTMDAFGAGSLAGSMLTGMAVACCFYGYHPDQQTQFFKDVAHNRGVRIEFFSDVPAALRWLGVGQSSAV
jgi:hypothetical protein